ncbi:hypothetical protein F183_A36820 [Bryobacterales bacterium F-183]|nr:hypothetical protein F183_A36820 [Bryobacterales bacterium F-183]
MSSELPIRRLRDVLQNAAAIADYTRGMVFEEFAGNRMVIDAVERCLQRICEAVAKLGEDAAVLLPGQPWYKIRAFGNVLRHEYDEIDPAHLWHIVQQSLPPLVEACQDSIARLDTLQ